MIYDCHPKKQNHKVHLILACLVLLSGVSFGISGITALHPVILQVVGLVLLIPAIQLFTRFMVGHYLYRLRRYEDGNVDLEVYLYRGGKRMQLVCRVGLEEITAVTPLCKENKTPKNGLKRYSYVPDLLPDAGTVLSISNGDGECEVLIHPDETLLQLLMQGCATPTAQTQKEEA